jgi:hypothetical protein
MFTDPFHKCTPIEIEIVLEQLSIKRRDHRFRAVGLAALRKKIEFYPDAVYYDLTQADLHPAPTLQILTLKNGIDLTILDGRVKTLQDLNDKKELTLNRHLVLDYIRFYFAHITGPHGITKIIDAADDLDLREEPTPGLRKSLQDKILPLALNGALSDAGYQISGTVLIDRSLHTVLIDVDADGRVILNLMKTLADQLSVRDVALEG